MEFFFNWILFLNYKCIHSRKFGEKRKNNTYKAHYSKRTHQRTWWVRQLSVVKIDLNWSRGHSHTLNHSPLITLKQEEIYQFFPSPTGRCFCILLLQQEEGRYFSCLATTQPMKDCYNSSNEKPLYFELPVSSNGLFVYKSPSELPLSSIKACYSTLYTGFAVVNH